MRRILALASCLALISIFGWPANPETSRAAHARRPNVLVIVTDDPRAFGTLKVMSSLQERIVQEGTRFRRAYATTPQCCPARASLMTGQYAHNHGVGNNAEGDNLDHASTIQRHLSRAGYRTGLVGKYINEWPLSIEPPYFDDFSLFSRGYYDSRWNINGSVRIVHRYSTRFVSSRARQFIQEAEATDTQPWYLYITPWAPHEEAIPEDHYRGRDVGELEKNPAMLETDCSDKLPRVDCEVSTTFVERKRRRMLRTLLSIDDLIESTYKTLDAKGELDQTLVVFMSDNGYLWGEHGSIGKRTPFIGGIEIPMVMSWPGHIKAGVVDQRLVANIDVAPTIYDAADVVPEITVDGHSLLDETWERDRLLLEYERFNGWPDWASTLTTDYQFTEYYKDSTSTAPVFTELYRLDEDPWELDNVLRDLDPENDPRPDVLLQMREQLAADRRCAGESCP